MNKKEWEAFEKTAKDPGVKALRASGILTGDDEPVKLASKPARETDPNPACCPICTSSEVVDTDVLWRAASLEDASNSVVLIEFQCRVCGVSFWA